MTDGNKRISLKAAVFTKIQEFLWLIQPRIGILFKVRFSNGGSGFVSSNPQALADLDLKPQPESRRLLVAGRWQSPVHKRH